MATFDLLERALEERPKLEGVTPEDIMELPQPLRESMQMILRVGAVSLSEMASDLGLNQDQAGRVADLLIDRGFLAAAGETPGGDRLYRINLAPRKRRRVPTDLWS